MNDVRATLLRFAMFVRCSSHLINEWPMSFNMFSDFCHFLAISLVPNRVYSQSTCEV